MHHHDRVFTFFLGPQHPITLFANTRHVITTMTPHFSKCRFEVNFNRFSVNIINYLRLWHALGLTHGPEFFYALNPHLVSPVIYSAKPLQDFSRLHGTTICNVSVGFHGINLFPCLVFRLCGVVHGLAVRPDNLISFGPTFRKVFFVDLLNTPKNLAHVGMVKVP